MNVKLMLDSKKFDKKPTGYETAGVQKRIQQTELAIEELAIGLCNGMTCKPALLNGTKSVDWIQQQVFMLDFDEGTTIEEELQNCNRLGIIPAFGYTSFSHSEEEHRFRLVFITDEVITDVDKRNKLQVTLINTFDKSDKVTFDPTRIFYGGNGKQPIQPNYDTRINADDIIEKYYKDEYIVSTPQNKGKGTKPKSGLNKNNIISGNTLTNTDYMDNINAIKSLDVDGLKGLINYDDSELEMVLDKEYTLLSSTPFSCKSEDEVYEYINSIDLCDFLNIDEGYAIECILPNHEDNEPSAYIWTTDDGTQIYKCFGCDTSLTIITLVEELAQCKRSKAIEFIKQVYNIKLEESDWVKENKKLMIDNANYIDKEEFKITYPYISKLIRTRKIHIQKLLLYFSQFINDNIQLNDKPLFYGGYNKLLDVCGINPNKYITLSQSLTLFHLLNMIEKVRPEDIPEKELNKAKSISAKYGFKKLTNFYQFEEYGILSLKQGERMAKVLIENNFSLKGLSREYVLRTFGIEVANKVYPQYKYENKKGTSNKSDKATLELASIVLDSIKKKRYILEKDVRGSGKQETQWKRSIQEILDTYGLVKVRASKDIKDKYNIPADIPYQSFIIVQEN